MGPLSTAAPFTSGPSADPVLLPAPPEARVPFVFPWAATVAPVVASVAIWALTRSPFALLFALLGPVVALASFADATRHSRRRRRRERARFDRETAVVSREIGDRHREERRRLDELYPSTSLLIERRDLARWHDPPGSPVPIGRGDVPSALEVRGDTVRRHPLSRTGASLTRLRAEAVVLDDGAVVVDPVGGVGVAGRDRAASSAARAVVLRLAGNLDPREWTIEVHAPAADPVAIGEEWMSELPHTRVVILYPELRSQRVEFVRRPGGPTVAVRNDRVVVATAVEAGDLPRRCRTVVDVTSGTVRRRDGGHQPPGGSVVRLDFVSVLTAVEAARSLRSAAKLDGWVGAAPDLADEVPLSALSNPPGAPLTRVRPSLEAEVGMAGSGPCTLDLVRDGPHAVIGGTTGSGKSELLTSWIGAMAARYDPREVAFLLVDFKGGAAFGVVADLPHCVGFVSDLEPARARRALESLRAELLHRERVVAEARARSIEELESRVLSRLVIVVDEFAALAVDLPELHALFADLAARGRSLGVHLILCTQRPASSVRDSILANCTLRISLRVNDAADSLALVGSTAASDLPRHPRGRALVSVAGDAPWLMQVAIADPAGVLEEARSRWGISGDPRRPWCEPLPDDLPLDRIPVAADGIAFGMTDLPDEQRQEATVWSPARQGGILVIGRSGSGRSGVLDAMARRAPRHIRVPSDVEGAWDALVDLDLMHRERLGSGSAVVVIDDLDVLLERLGPDHRPAVDAILRRLLRDGPGRGTAVVAAVRSVPPGLHGLVAAFGSRLILGLADRSEHVVAGGSGPDFDPRMPPGGGFWNGRRIQVGRVPTDSGRAVSAAIEPPEVDFPPGGVTAVVTSTPRATASVLRSRRPAGRAEGHSSVEIVELGARDPSPDLAVTGGTVHRIVVGDVDAWQAQWAALPRLRGRMRFVFHGVGVSDYRSISRTGVLPPVLASDDHVWVIDTEDRVTRATLASRTGVGEGEG